MTQLRPSRGGPEPLPSSCNLHPSVEPQECLRPSTTHVCLAGKRKKREYSRQFGRRLEISDQFRPSEARARFSPLARPALKPESVKLNPCAWEYGRLCRTRSARNLPWKAGSVRSKRAAEMALP